MRLQRLLDLSQAADGDSFQRQLIDLANEMEFGLVSALVVTDMPNGPAQVVRLGNTPSAYLAAYKDSDSYSRDPVMQRLKTLSVPVIYDQSLYVREAAADLWEEQAQFGYRSGISVALHLPGQRHFVLGLDREPALPKSEAKLMRMLGDLQLLVVHAQETALRLFGKPLTDVALSPKEQLILRMTMQGKSAKVIGAEIHSAEATINFHLQNARVKLGVTSKHQAVLKAQSLGLI
ncbi:helix-turn-helix transcriptional regulator [Scleromatobacter humisilvae]|uniref:LuxR family transcriptional regulator n=1 Tax=Scleromatobacter humisilvae TaxID=2897159 RepID=A0A9X1YN83_9BURK|nr:autoinducer binding domain-containing protein [Scleromatobacter humisilvae]MCK9688902.1 LuxR family transcriptional regulator [Scleromatobacter humisilvae]